MTAASTPGLPAGYSVRAPRLGDAEAVAEVKRAAHASRRDGEITADSVREDWALPRMDLERDAWVVLTPDGSVAASALVFEDFPGSFVRVHCVRPGPEGPVLERYLLDVCEERVRDRLTAGARSGSLTVIAFESERPSLDLYTARGYGLVRTFLRLAVSLDDAPAVPVVPQGLAIRPFRAGEDERRVYEAVQEAFLDHWEPTELTYEEWRAIAYDAPTVDPALWRVAWDGADVAGVVIASAQTEDGWVDDLAVRRPWRGRGLGRALLLTALEVLRARGLTRALLGVDTDNPTGAMGLYASAGMTQSGDAHLVFRRQLSAR